MVDRHVIWNSLQDAGVPLEFLVILSHLFDDVSISVSISGYSSSRLFSYKDTKSAIFKSTKNPDKKYYRPDITFYARATANTVIEIGNAEIKPRKATKYVVDLDRVKILEVAKRQLHLRLKMAQSPEELFTFAMLVHGEKIEQYIVYFKDGFYGYTLMAKFIFPNSRNSVALIDNALELLLGLKDCMKRSIAGTPTGPASSVIYNAKKNSLISTVSYCHKYKKRS